MESMQPGNFQRRNKETLFLLSSLRFGYHVSLNKISSHVAEVSSISTLINIKLATSSSLLRYALSYLYDGKLTISDHKYYQATLTASEKYMPHSFPSCFHRRLLDRQGTKGWRFGGRGRGVPKPAIWMGVWGGMVIAVVITHKSAQFFWEKIFTPCRGSIRPLAFKFAYAIPISLMQGLMVELSE